MDILGVYLVRVDASLLAVIPQFNARIEGAGSQELSVWVKIETSYIDFVTS